MFSIGDFSRIARVSCRLLRYYNEIGLLTPATIDRTTGYRYYSAGQLPRLNRILVLKELGFSLDDIAHILDRSVSSTELRGMLTLRRADVERAVAEESHRLRQIETRIAQIDSEGQLSDDDVVIRAEPARHFLSVRQILPDFAAARDRIGEIVTATRKKSSALGQVMAIAHAAEFEPDQLDVEIGFAVEPDTAPSVHLSDGRSLTIREVPAVEHMAVCVRVGLPERAHLVTSRIGLMLESSGFSLDGASREVFLQPPNPDRMHESVVEMQFPVRKGTR